jgi:hypothetical protein
VRRQEPRAAESRPAGLPAGFSLLPRRRRHRREHHVLFLIFVVVRPALTVYYWLENI